MLRRNGSGIKVGEQRSEQCGQMVSPAYSACLAAKGVHRRPLRLEREQAPGSSDLQTGRNQILKGPLPQPDGPPALPVSLATSPGRPVLRETGDGEKCRLASRMWRFIGLPHCACNGVEPIGDFNQNQGTLIGSTRSRGALSSLHCPAASFHNGTTHARFRRLETLGPAFLQITGDLSVAGRRLHLNRREGAAKAQC